MNRYRSRFEIIRDILLVVASDNGSKKTRIMYGANLSYKLLTRYLEEILKVGLLMCDGNSCYSLTERGKRFLKMYKDYEQNQRKLEKNINDLESVRDILREMLIS